MTTRVVGPNLIGRDFIIGDLHGMYDLLIEKLMSVEFDIDRDRLFSVGDLIDRGPQSLECITLLEYDWFYAVRGNHESMLMEFVNCGTPDFLCNGGMWFLNLSPEDQEYVYELIRTKMTGNIDCHDFYITHARWGFDNWDREFYYLVMGNEFDAIGELDKICYVGHNPVRGLIHINGHIMLDTGACFRDGFLTMVEHNGNY